MEPLVAALLILHGLLVQRDRLPQRLIYTRDENISSRDIVE